VCVVYKLVNRKYFAGATVLESLGLFGPLDEKIKFKILECKKRAVIIKKYVSAGKMPPQAGSLLPPVSLQSSVSPSLFELQTCSNSMGVSFLVEHLVGR
jgi:hypothetical protein